MSSTIRNTRLRRRSRSSRSNILAAKVLEETRVLASVSSSASERIGLAGMTEVRRAGGVGVAVGAREDLARGCAADHVPGVLEHVALRQDLSARIDLERVATALIPVVVDGVEQCVAADFGGASRGVVDVVALEGDEVVGSGEV